MKRYEEYKPTKYPWLPIVPSHWKTIPMRALTVVSSERRGSRDAVLLSVYREYGVIVKSSRDDNHNVESEDLSNYKMVYKGDLVMNKMKMWQGSLGVSEFEGVVSPAYIVCHIIDENINRRYLHMLLRSPLFKTYYNQVSYGVRVGQWDMHYEDFKGMEVSLPPRAEQYQIVRYLDWQVSKINRLIAAKKKQIELLKEQKQVRIDETCFGSISQDSVYSMEWGRMIPNGWDTIKLNGAFNFGKGLQITKANLKTEGVPVISYGQVHAKTNTGTSISDDLIRFVDEAYLSSSPSSLVNVGDYIFADTSEDFAGVGNCVYVDRKGPLFAGYHTVIIRPTDCRLSRYTAYLFKTSTWRYQLQKRVNGVKVFSVTQKILKDAYILIPPKEEQDRIVRELDSYCNAVDLAIAAITHQIETMVLFRTRLISDVVTGQVDVRGIEVPEYEHVDDIDAVSELTDESDEDTEVE